MTRIIRMNLSIFALAAVALIAAPVAHAQDSTSGSPEQAQYAPPPPPPVVYVQTPPQQRPEYRDRWHSTIAVGATRQLSQSMTNGGPATVWTTDSTGVLATIRATPFWGTGTEINYQYTQLTEQYRAATAVPGVFVRTGVASSFHELTGAFVFESHMRGVKPFLSLGGGAIDFVPLGNQPHQWRGTGLAEFGFDIPATHHVGVRLQGRGLFYRAPNFNNAAFESRSWVATVEPAISIYSRW